MSIKSLKLIIRFPFCGFRRNISMHIRTPITQISIQIQHYIYTKYFKHTLNASIVILPIFNLGMIINHTFQKNKIVTIQYTVISLVWCIYNTDIKSFMQVVKVKLYVFKHLIYISMPLLLDVVATWNGNTFYIRPKILSYQQ